MLRMFGAEGKRSIDSIVMNEALENVNISSPKDVWNLYDRYIEEVVDLYGEDIAEIFEYESMKEMESMFCTRCPLYESVSKRRN
jgi:hypothetical protein